LAAVAAAQQVFEQPAGKQLGLITASKPVADSPAAQALPALPQPLALLALRATLSGGALAAGPVEIATTQQSTAALAGLAGKVAVVAVAAG